MSTIILFILSFVVTSVAYPGMDDPPAFGGAYSNISPLATDKFIQRVSNLHNKGNVKDLANFFDDFFYFNGCGKTYNKTTMIDYIHNTPQYRNAHFYLEILHHAPEQTVALIEILHIQKRPMHILYHMDREMEHVYSGYNLDCDKPLRLQ